jgi:stage IV sporulation protein FB
MFEGGYTTVGKVWRIPLRLHFSLVFGLLYVSGLRFDPGAWLGYFVLVLVHELGHALLVRAYRLRVFSIEMHALGGACRHEPARTRIAESVIAWGGVLGQLCLFALAMVVLRLWPPSEPWLASFWAVMVGANLTIIAINLLPIAPLDGARAWQLPKLWLARRRGARPRPKKKLSTKAKPKDARKAERTSNQAGKGVEQQKLKLVRGEDGDFRFEEDDES